MIQLANTPASHVTRVGQSVFEMFSSTGSSPAAPQLISQIPQHTMHRPVPSPEPNPEPNPGPDAAWRKECHHSPIAPADWDALFRAVQTRLEQCVGDALLRTPRVALHDRHALTKASVLDCIEAMTQLHASLTLERELSQAHQLQHTQSQHRKEH